MNKITHDYIQYYQDLKRPLKWKVTDKRIIMTIASIYALNQKPLHVESFLDLANKVRNSASYISVLRSTSRYTTAALLDVKFHNPDEKIQELHHTYNLFREEKFKSGVFTYIAASVLLTNPKQNPKLVIQKAKEVYDGMKKEHSFLTTSSDYPLATLLALDYKTGIISTIEELYDELSRYGFRKGNDLQFMSQILALSINDSKNTLVNRAIHVMDSLQHTGIKPKKMYYPIIGMLALLPQNDFIVHEIISTYEDLNSQGDFKWQKDMNIILASNFFLMDKLTHEGLAETSLYTILETVLQAQQAVMAAAVYSGDGGASGDGGS
ncbi:DUF4003 family protein [Ornithinibacillus scapharcae]|uniref:DUF4003 family protein n=1 Tax=Ornithinibacillus scapharcae TaxID=1147159 RepID=UPI000225AB51|nr:DUF4003 family protein [Ornithinibacillus scapharcae]